MSISQRGDIWVQHDTPALASLLDGYGVKKRRLLGLTTAHLYESRVGQIWAGVPDGIMELREENWLLHPVSEIRTQTQRNRALPLLPLRQGHVLFLLPDRLMELNADPSQPEEAVVVRQAAQTRLDQFFDLVQAADGGLWITGKRGLAKIPSPRPASPQTVWEEFLTDESIAAHDLQHPFEDDQGGVTMIGESGRDHKKIIVYFDGKQWSSPPTKAEDIRLAWRGPDQGFWVLTPKALFHLEKQNDAWIETEEHLAQNYYDAASEPGGVFWVATSEGLFRYAPLTWREAAGERSRPPVSTMLQERDGPIWMARSNSLSRFQDEQWRDFQPDPAVNIPANESLHTLPDGTLVIGTGTALLRFDPKKEAFNLVPHPTQAGVKTLGLLTNGLLCVQIFDNRGATNGAHLETFDGQTFRSLADLPGSWNLGADLQVFFTSQNGTIWIGGSGGLALYRDQKWLRFDTGQGPAPESACCMIELADGKLWCGTRDKIWQYDGKNWTVLQSDFDHINGFYKSDDGSVWIASNSGVTRYFRGEWVLNGAPEGLPSPVVRQVLQDRRGRIWAASVGGLSLYHPEADAEPPQTFLEQPRNVGVITEGQIQFSFGGRDKWKRTAADRLLFSYRLDEQEWSPFRSERAVSFSDLSRGPHFFQVRAMDRNWNLDPKPALVDILIPLPWYEETRLLWSAAIGGAAALFFAALAFNRHRRLVRSYAEVEKIVALRTQQLDKANQQLFQGQKMNALGTLAAGIAHDFNSILSIIKGSAQIIESNLENQEKVRTRLDRIKTAVDQGAGIVKAMLGFSRSTESQAAPCDLNALAGETIQLLGDRFQRDAQIQFHPDHEVPEVVTTKDYVQQILLNFVLNAAEALDGPGQIVVRTGGVNTLPSDMVLSPAGTGCYVFVAVQDFGCGIAPDILPRIFEPFFTTKSLSTKRGTGLGLSMVYELAKTMGAGLMVQSTLGQGSTFTLVLPAEKSGAAAE